MADAANDIEEGGGVTALKDLFAGAVGGIAQVLIGEFFILFVWFKQVSFSPPCKILKDELNLHFFFSVKLFVLMQFVTKYF